MAGQGHAPFSSCWARKARKAIYTNIRWASTDTAIKAALLDFFFNSSTVTKKFIRYWTGTAWVNLDMGYTPSESANWAEVPSYASTALDRLAARIIVNSAPPTSPLEGDLWVDIS